MLSEARHLLAQRRVLAALAGTVTDTVTSAAARRLGLARPRPTVVLPGPEISAEVAPPPAALVREYVRHVGGDPAAYRDELPPHLFPQWTVPIAARVLRGLDYPMLRVVNAGVRLELRGPIPRGPLQVRARLEGIEDDGRKAILRQRIVTGTARLPDALVAELTVIVPTGRRGEGAKKAPARVPEAARELARWRLRPDAGLSFGLYTGDLNPIHWVAPYARASGFKRPILHGFATLARAMEGLGRGLFAGSVHRLAGIEVRFARPLVLPARVGLFVRGPEVFVGDAPGGPAYLTGTFTERIP